ncbi:MAG TPA: hypothetical protein VKA63_01580 [Candidatus Krumholzibacteria bacterium]|nr:hypothetical protein [Candidatus Krumholzibacteria bacterium]
MIHAFLAIVIALTAPSGAPNRTTANGYWPAIVDRIEAEAGLSLLEVATLETGLRGAGGLARMTVAGLDVFYVDSMRLPEAAHRITDALVASDGNAAELSHHAFTLIGAPAGGYGPPVRGSASGETAIALAADIEQALSLLGRSRIEGGIGLELSAESRHAWSELDTDASVE